MAPCPQCDDSVLVHTMLTENLAAYSCGKCLGTLVSLVSYRAWRDHAARGALAETGPAAIDVDPPDSIGAKKCPEVPLAHEQVPHQQREDQSPRLLPALRGSLAR